MSSSGRINLDAVSKEMQLDRDAQTRIVDTYSAAYQDLLGYMPPRVEARFGITGVLDPQLVELQEKMRSHAMDTAVLDPKITQMVLFGMLLMDGNDAAQTHCIAARRANATWAELQAIISLCFLFRGLPAANCGAEMLGKVAAREAEMAAVQKAS